MNVLLLGSGGREHAIAWKISESSLLSKLYIAPGNAGTREVGENVDLDPLDFKAIRKFAIDKKIELVVVGPEAPLVAGIHDFFLADKDLRHIGVVGPDKVGAQLEGSKDFAKQFMLRHGVPTARYATFTSATVAEGQAFLTTLKPPFVLKADGLAAGKGVLILNNLKEAQDALKTLLDGQFGEASSKVVIEEFLDGIEMSAFVITDGDSYKVLPEAKDYKRIGEGDTGPNTGGMGAVSPVPFATPEFLDKVENQVIIPTIKGLKADGIVYKGFIFFGLMKVGNEPYVIEYNCRMGDPETEVVIPRVKSDLLEILSSVSNGTLSEQHIETDPRYATTIMLVAQGYPDAYEKGKEMKGFDRTEGSLLFHAGTKINKEKIVTNGGRILAITSLAHHMGEALETSLANAEKIEYAGKNYRRDIGQDLMRFAVKS